MRLLCIIVIGFFVIQTYAQGTPFVAISKKGDTIRGKTRRKVHPYSLDRGFNGLNEKGDPMSFNPKKYSKVWVDTLYLESVQIGVSPKQACFAKPLIEGHLSLYLVRFFNTSAAPPMGIAQTPISISYTQSKGKQEYIIVDKAKRGTKLNEKVFRKYPHRYFGSYPFILEKLNSSGNNYDSIPLIIDEYNREKPYLKEIKRDVECVVITNSKEELTGTIKNYDFSFRPTLGFRMHVDSIQTKLILPTKNDLIKIDTLIYKAKPDTKEVLYFMKEISTGPAATLYEHSLRIRGNVPGKGTSNWVEKEYFLQSGDIWIPIKEKELLRNPERYFPESPPLCKYIRNREREEIDLIKWVEQYNEMVP